MRAQSVRCKVVVLINIIEDLNRRLELTILPTEQCNFRCIYCYEDFLIGKMSAETVLAIKHLLEQRIPDLKTLIIRWYGGEPLLAQNVISDVMEHVNYLKKEYNPNLEVLGLITTNASLLKVDKLSELVKKGIISYQISFDGDREEHNKLRHSVSGDPTFDTIWNNIVFASKTNLDFSIIIRMHVNSKNLTSMKRFIRRIKADLGTDKRFSLLILPLSKYGGKNDETLPIIETKKPLKELIEYAKSLNLKIFRENPLNLCYAARPYAFVIRATGDIQKCPVLLYSAEYNNVGKLLPDGSLELDPNKVAMWSRGMVSKNKKDLICPARNFPGVSLAYKSAKRDFD